jgi:hypothetical protein
MTKKKEKTKLPLTVLLIDNQAIVKMSINYKVTVKNRHVARKWHFVILGVKDRFILEMDSQRRPISWWYDKIAISLKIETIFWIALM